MRRLLAALATLVFVSLAVPMLPAMRRLVRRDFDLQRLPYDARREQMFGAFYSSLAGLRPQLREAASIALLPRNGQVDVDTALFANYYLYPRRTRIYAGALGLRQYRQRPDVAREPVMLHIDNAVSPRLRAMSYGEIRFEDLGAERLVRDPQLSGIAYTVAVPLAVSFDGPWPDVYATEATFVNPPDDAARVRVTLQPQGVIRDFFLAAGETRTMRDVVWETFGAMETGWLQVSVSKPLRVAFYFVNRGRGDAARLPIVPLDAEVRATVHGERLWLVNPRTEAVDVQVNDETISVPARGQLQRAIAGSVRVEGDVFAFATTKDASTGRTTFAWP